MRKAIMSAIITCGLAVFSVFVYADDGGASGTPSYTQSTFQKADLGSKDVASDGSMSTSYPLGDVALCYNSNSGWTLRGFSTIMRDVKKGVPAYDDDKDVFLLEGEELVRVTTGGTPANCREYRTRHESFRQVLYYYNYSDWAKSYWVVKNPDGSAAEYKNPGLGVDGLGENKAWGWAVTKETSKGTYEYKTYSYVNNMKATFHITEFQIYWIESRKTDALSDRATCIFGGSHANSYSFNYRAGCKLEKNYFPYRIVSLKGRKQNGGYAVASEYIIEASAGLGGQWLVDTITPYGDDVVYDLENKTVISGSALPPVKFEYIKADQSSLQFDQGEGVKLNLGNSFRYSNGCGTTDDVYDIDGDGLPEKLEKYQIADDKFSVLRTWDLFRNKQRNWNETDAIPGVSPYYKGFPLAGVDNQSLGKVIKHSKTSGYVDMDGDGRLDRVVKAYFYKYNDSAEPVASYGLAKYKVIAGDALVKVVAAKRFTDNKAIIDGYKEYYVPDQSSTYSMVFYHNTTTAKFPSGAYAVFEIIENRQDGTTMLIGSGMVSASISAIPSQMGEYDAQIYLDRLSLVDCFKINRLRLVVNPEGDRIPQEKVWIRFHYQRLSLTLEKYTSYDNYSFKVWKNLGYGEFDTTIRDWGNTDDLGLTASKQIVENGKITREYVISDVLDINGDGLPDRVRKSTVSGSDFLKVWLNDGTAFVQNAQAKVWRCPDGSDGEGSIRDYYYNNSPPQNIGDLSLTGGYQGSIIVGGTTKYFTMYETADFQGGYSTVSLDCGTSGVYLEFAVGSPDHYISIGHHYSQTGAYDYSIAPQIGFQNLLIISAGTRLPGIYSVKLKNGKSYEGNDTWFDYLDMNGDGLIDRVKKKPNEPLVVWYNNGNGFENPVTWHKTDDAPLRDTNKDLSIYFTEYDIVDMNGDGLPDRVWKVHVPGDPHRQNLCPIYVWFNTGNDFVADDVEWKTPVTFGYYPVGLRYSTPGTVRQDFLDVNGDGLIDLVATAANRAFDYRVWYSNGGTIGKMKRILHPDGAKVEYAYKAIDKTLNPECRIAQWVVSAVNVSDGINPGVVSTAYDFEKGVYDNREREFRGFGCVKKTGPTGDYVTTYYHTDEQKAGLAQSESIYNKNNKPYSNTVYRYEVVKPEQRHVSGFSDKIILVKIRDTMIITTDGNQAPGDAVKVKKIAYTYAFDANGFIEQEIITNYGEVDDLDPDTAAEVGYDKQQAIAIYKNDASTWICLPVMNEVWGYEGNTDHFVRQSAAKNTYSVDGKYNLEKTEQWNGDNERALEINSPYWVNATAYEYDAYGNLVKLTEPEGVKNGGYVTRTEYESKFRKYPIRITNALGHNKDIVYDDHSRKVTERDFNNGLEYNTRYDAFGRVIKRWGPSGNESNPYQEIVYIDWADAKTPAFPRGVITKNREKAGEAKTLETYAYRDGLGRTIQIKSKFDSTQYKTADTFYGYKDTLSITKRFITYLTSKTDFTPPQDRPVDQPGTQTEDYLCDNEGRVTKIINTDGTVVKTAQKLWVSTTTDARGVEKRTFYDGQGKVVQIIEPDGAEKKISNDEANNIRTSYEYFSGTGALAKVTDASGNTTVLRYNMLGQKTDVYDPDMGHMSFYYNANGAMVEAVDANAIVTRFTYDALGRKTRADYPDGIDGKKNYEEFYYDAFSGGENRAGKLVAIWKRVNLRPASEKSMYEYFYYDANDNIIKTTRQFMDGSLFVNQTAESEFDLAGRMVKKKMPDGEVVNYAYDESGELDAVKGLSDYVKNIIYLPYGNIKQIWSGGGYFTAYTYDDAVLPSYRIKRIESSAFMYEYTYDEVGNVMTITDSRNSQFSQKFDYDPLNRMVGAAGKYGDMRYLYDDLGNMLKKENNVLKYLSAKPHAVTDDGAYLYTYDAKGSLAQKLRIGVGLSSGSGSGGTSPGVPPVDFNVEYCIDSDWGTGFTAHLIITNTGSSVVNGWELAWTFPGNQRITNLWNGALQQTGKTVRVTEAGWNNTIPIGGSVGFGFQGTYDGPNENPADFALNGIQPQPRSGGESDPITLPQEVLYYGVYGIKSVTLNDRAELRNMAGGYSAVGSNGAVEVGSRSRIGHITARQAFARDYSSVYGDVRVKNDFTTQYGVFVGGNRYERAGFPEEVLPASITTARLDFTGVSKQDTVINSYPGPTLNPGAYWNYSVQGRGMLNLKTGTYYFNKFEMSQFSVLNLDETNGPVKIFVQESLKLNGAINHSRPGREGTAYLLVGYLGNQDVFFGAIQHHDDFGCSIIAPQARLIGGQDGSAADKIFEGMYVGKEVCFHQDSQVTFVPFIEYVLEIFTYRYDWNNNLIEVRQNDREIMSAVYDASGNRVAKKERNETKVSLFPEYESRYGSNNALVRSTKYYFAGAKRVAERDSENGLIYYLKDHLGSSSVVINESDPRKVNYYYYLPFGGGLAQDIGITSIDHKYNDKELDGTGLYYYGARYYNPATGRFISADTVTPGNGAASQGLNRYSYCLNNPMKYVDPNGHDPAAAATSQSVKYLWPVMTLLISGQSPTSLTSAPVVNPPKGVPGGLGLLAGFGLGVSTGLASLSGNPTANDHPLFGPAYNVLPHQIQMPDSASLRSGGASERDSTSNRYSIAYFPGGYSMIGGGFGEAMAKSIRNYAVKFDTVKIVENYSVWEGAVPSHENMMMDITNFLKHVALPNVVFIKANWALYASTITNSNSGVYFVAPQYSDWILEGDKNLSIMPRYGTNVYSDLPFPELGMTPGWIYQLRSYNDVKAEGIESRYLEDEVHTYKKK